MAVSSNPAGAIPVAAPDIIIDKMQIIKLD